MGRFSHGKGIKLQFAKGAGFAIKFGIVNDALEE
jgi:hypothetical protein